MRGFIRGGTARSFDQGKSDDGELAVGRRERSKKRPDNRVFRARGSSVVYRYRRRCTHGAPIFVTPALPAFAANAVGPRVRARVRPGVRASSASTSRSNSCSIRPAGTRTCMCSDCSQGGTCETRPTRSRIARLASGLCAFKRRTSGVLTRRPANCSRVCLRAE